MIGILKPVESQKREKLVNKKPNLNHTDYAYHEAVNRLKSMLTDSYGHARQSNRHPGYESDDTDNVSVIERPSLSEVSRKIPSSGLSRYCNPHSSYSTQLNTLKPAESIANLQPVSQYVSPAVSTAISVAKPNNELLQFIEKQEGYIEQLERESHFCRGELNNVLTKVKDVISENEALTEQTKLGTIASDTSDSGSNDYNYRGTSNEKHEKIKLSGPNIVFESRISELEAQLAQAEIDIKKLTQENNHNRQRLANGESMSSNATTSEAQNRQIETLQRDKKLLEDTVRKLQFIVDSLKASDAQNFSNTLRSRDLVEQSAFEKAQSDIEIRRLRDELERQHARVREMQLEMTKKIAEERTLAERRYNYHVQQVDGDLSSQWETSSRLQLELERQKRAEADYRRDLTQKNSQIEDLRTEMKQKTTSLLSDIAQVNAEKQSLEQEITSLRMQLERAERQTKVESSRLNAEIMSLRQRLDRADADLLQSKRENLRLSDEVAALEKEITLGDLNRETRPSKELTKLMSDMESKHLATVSELEGMVQGQRQLMEKLTAECKTLTNKLEDATLKHKQEMNTLQSNIDYLTTKIDNNIDKTDNEGNFKFEQDTNQAPYREVSEPYEIDTMQEPKSILSTCVSPSTSFKPESNGRTSQQSRRGSLYETQRRLSQQSNHGFFNPENPISDAIATESDDKYVQDSFETEKPKSNRTSPDDDEFQSNDLRRKGSIRFYDEVQSIEENKRNEAVKGYAQNEYDYEKDNQTQVQPQLQQQQQQDQIYSQTHYEQPDNIYGTGEYDASQYVEQQDYDGNQYNKSTLQSQNEYEYQTGYGGYDAKDYEQSAYQPSDQPTELSYQPEQYNAGLYQERTTPRTSELGKNQTAQPKLPQQQQQQQHQQHQQHQQQSYTEPTPSNANLEQKHKGNANSTAYATNRQQPMSKQPTKKNYT